MSRRRATFGKSYLHQVMWIEIHGPIPEDHVIHHKDFNGLNNDDENLQCMTKSAHGLLHALHRLKHAPRITVTCKECKKVFITTTRRKWCSGLCTRRDAARRNYEALRSDPKRWEEYLQAAKDRYTINRASTKPYRPHRTT